jgi:hypothetical protein
LYAGNKLPYQPGGASSNASTNSKTSQSSNAVHIPHRRSQQASLLCLPPATRISGSNISNVLPDFLKLFVI